MRPAYPLFWPVSYPRAKYSKRSAFGNTTVGREVRYLQAELNRLGCRDGDFVVSTNIELRLDGLPRSGRRTPDDSGVAVYFMVKGQEHVLACDKWDRIEHNLRAIVRHIEALRGMDRWGVGSIEQAFAGYKALPSGSDPHWTLVFEIERDATPHHVKGQHRKLSMKYHPDRGGNGEQFKLVQRAWKQYREEVGA